jgi:hypothetical protein
LQCKVALTIGSFCIELGVPYIFWIVWNKVLWHKVMFLTSQLSYTCMRQSSYYRSVGENILFSGTCMCVVFSAHCRQWSWLRDIWSAVYELLK